MLLGLEAGLDGSSDHVVLVAEPSQGAHLLIFHGRGLVIQRSFPLPALDADASETLFIEISRLLQFYKQKHRKAAFEVLHVLGLAELDPALARKPNGAPTRGADRVTGGLGPPAAGAAAGGRGGTG